MAATYAHAIVADLLVSEIENHRDDGLPEDYQNFILENSLIIQVGSFCPDLPYLDEVVASKIPLYDADEQKRWGDLMHYVHTGKLIFFAVEELKRLKTQNEMGRFKKCFQWFLGFVSHLIVDTVIHPVVEEISGPYEKDPTGHRKCEMHQDVWLNQEVYKTSVPQVNTISAVVYCNDHEIIEFWSHLFQKCYNFYFLDETPRFDAWFNEYQQKLSISSRTMSEFGITHGLTYPPIGKVNKKKYIIGLKTPLGGKMDYIDIVKEVMLKKVYKYWKIIVLGIEGASDEYQTIPDFNLDTGKFYRTNAYVSWSEL